jgi:hypothetical protein
MKTYEYFKNIQKNSEAFIKGISKKIRDRWKNHLKQNRKEKITFRSIMIFDFGKSSKTHNGRLF